MAFIGQRIGEPLKWRHIGRNIEGHNIEDKIHCTDSKLAETYVKVQQQDVICETQRVKQTRRQNMAEIVGGRLSEIKYIKFI